jgi:hypothetical protein
MRFSVAFQASHHLKRIDWAAWRWLSPIQHRVCATVLIRSGRDPFRSVLTLRKREAAMYENQIKSMIYR